MSLTRRGVLASLAGLFVAPAVATATSPIPAAAPLEAFPLSLEYGFSLNGEVFETGFASRLEAMVAGIEHAQNCGHAAVTVAQVQHWSLYVSPTLANDMVEGLLNCDPRRPCDFGTCMVQSLVGSNQDGDFEGDFEDQAYSCDRAQLGVDATKAVAAAFCRAGAENWAVEVEKGQPLPNEFDFDHPLLDVVGEDTQLSAELAELLRNWCDANKLEPQLRSLHIYGEEEHVVALAEEHDILV